MNFTVDIVSETYLDESSEGLDVRLSDLMVILRGEDRGVRIAITRVSNGYRIECPGQEPEHLSSADELHRAYLKRVAAHWPEVANKAAVHRVANRLARLVGMLD